MYVCICIYTYICDWFNKGFICLPTSYIHISISVGVLIAPVEQNK